MTFEEKIIDLFKRYDVLLVYMDGKIVPVKNTTKQECYNLLYDIQELIEWRKNDFKYLELTNAPTVTPQAFINGIVELISKNGITTIDELLETLKGGAE